MYPDDPISCLRDKYFSRRFKNHVMMDSFKGNDWGKRVEILARKPSRCAQSHNGCGGSRLSQLPQDAHRRLGHGVAGSSSRTGCADPMADMHGALQRMRSLQDIHMEGSDNEDHVESDEVSDIDTPDGSMS
ncbi:hypothetical protein L2E82_45727 [Cichorium intybus]|uniref:Uncharacterized protein n=1 Tax=Cichorium intybus TaxID=13427 RepID=A0ACB8ZTV7_CICIN|nr:hypothetical protein L2E82_45727 [Cichorium intybus]